MQGVGDYVVVAMEQPASGPAGAYILKVDGTSKPTHVTTKLLEGYPSTVKTSTGSASAAGMVKLADGGYLMAISGGNFGLKGVWFFITEDAISPTMKWRFLDFWEPTEVGGACNIEDGKFKGCYVGGGGATGLVNDCNGNIYLVVTNGTAGWGYDDEFAQACRLTQSSDNKVHLSNIWNSKRKIGQISIDVPSHRWGAGVAVTNKNKLALISTERGTNDGDNATVDGWIRLAGENRTGL